MASDLAASLPFLTVRILGGDPETPAVTHCGTGFFFSGERGGKEFHLVITNKHVIHDRSWLQLDLAEADENGKRKLGPPVSVRLPPKDVSLVYHPDPKVDLAGIFVAPFADKAIADGHKLFFTWGGEAIFPTETIQQHLTAAASTIMIGFPQGLIDTANNLPFVRRGILATPFSADFQGNKEFAVDMAIFGGSSGSPVFSHFEGMTPTEDGGWAIGGGKTFHLIGVLWGGATYTAKGELVPNSVPTTSHVPLTNVMMNIGYCIKAERISELLDEIVKIIAAQGDGGPAA